jgi:penicillin-insensitive murein endopeptidase
MTMIRAVLLSLLLAAPAQAEKLANKLFGAMDAPSAQDSMPIGSYAKGCAAGLVELPETGPTWQAMRLSRNRNFGQPAMIRFLMDLSATARDIGFGKGLYVGDISQPRGGPMTSGHASHQIGLDADIWMLPPRSLNLTEAEREAISSSVVRSDDQRSVTGNWTGVHRELLKQAASDPRVDRIFVAAAVKIEMCKTAKAGDKKWLQKVRPVAGHEAHFHVRLKGGDGCDETLMWWVTDYLDPPKADPNKPKEDDAPKKKGPRDYTMADLPKQCKGVLAAD